MKIVFLDAYSVGDADISALYSLGEFISYENTNPEQVVPRCAGAGIVITNKVKLMKHEIDTLPELKLICIAATGMNNVDLEMASKKGIIVKNVAGYSTDSVAELTFTIVLGLIHKTGYYDNLVKCGKYSQIGRFTNQDKPFSEIKNKEWGIIGMGTIGHRVAEIATAFGAKVSYYSTSGKNLDAGYTNKSLEKLLSESDIITIHAPLNDNTKYLLDYKKLCLMKPDAYIVNVGRGGIIKETDLAQALKDRRIAGAGLDVFESEPIPANNPLLSEEISDRLIFTPHIAWASVEARKRLVDTIAGQIAEFCKNNE